MATEHLIGGYRLLNLMMTGQTSQVWEVTEPGSGRHFAMKLLLPEFIRDHTHRQYLVHEAKVGMSIHHTNVIRMLRLAKDKDIEYLIMEFFPGANLKMRLHRKHPLVRDKAHSIIMQAASGLAHLHDKGWVHRDVKPDNILLNSAGEVRLIDFALAKRIQRSRGWFAFMKKGGKTMGTRSYMSPEQILNRNLDERADLYSFGVTLYELVAGRPPFRGISPHDLLTKHLREKPASPKIYNPEVSDEYTALVMRMLSKDKKDRPRDLHDFINTFRVIRVFTGDKLERPGEMG